MKFSKLLNTILVALRTKPMIGGLEIGDSILRFANWNGEAWNMTSVRFPQGVIRGGEIQDRNEFLRVLTTLRSQIVGSDTHAHVNVVVCLSSVNIYAQVFSLPLLQGESLEKAINLNMQMISPANISDVYAGFQVVHRDQEKFITEVLAAFLEKKIVHNLNQVLEDAGFVVVAVESRPLSLARLAKHIGVGIDEIKPHILLSVDPDGIDVLVVRNGELYFDYFSPWQEVQADAREISSELFRTTIVRNLHQVFNFYTAHWSEPLESLFYVSTGLGEEVEQIVKENFSVNVRALKTTIQGEVPPDWYVALGAGIRGTFPRREDAEISLLGIDVKQQFRRQQTIGFLRLWRLIVPATLAILLFVFLGVDFFLMSTKKSIALRPTSSLPADQLKVVGNLEAQAKSFNQLVAMVGEAEQGGFSALPIVMRLNQIAQISEIAVTRLSVPAPDAQIILTGSAKSQDALLQFKKSLEGDPVFKDISLALGDVQPGPQGVTFSIRFALSSPKTP